MSNSNYSQLDPTKKRNSQNSKSFKNTDLLDTGSGNGINRYANLSAAANQTNTGTVNKSMLLDPSMHQS